MNNRFSSILVLSAISLAIFAQTPKTASLEELFKSPLTSSKAYVWWHWSGSNFSKEGITKDLEAMKEIGVGGATIFNIASAVQETQAPTLNNPWPHQTYRSPEYWDALLHAAKEAQRLDLELGLHNTVGYSTTGGPWIDESKAMKKLAWSVTVVKGGGSQTIELEYPPMLPYEGWGSDKQKPIYPTQYTEIAVIAVPDKNTFDKSEIIDLTNKATGDKLTWNVPPGEWKIYRIGSVPTMACPHPNPDELIGKTLEVDKINPIHTEFHWDNVLIPFKKKLGKYVGTTFKHMLIDSYEAGNQNWSDNFCETFIKLKGYDPTIWLVSMGKPITERNENTEKNIINTEEQTARFEWDYTDVISQMYYVNNWKIGKERLTKEGMLLQFEPYEGPFNTIEGAALADIPMGEFWTGRGQAASINPKITGGARAAGRTVIGAEAYTGRPETSSWIEDPEYLKQTTEGVFASGVNRMILHHWVHQPFDDKYQPGMGMGWWGTHFNRHQTWFEPGKAFFSYLARAQTMLQHGEQVADYICLDEAPGYCDMISTGDFLRNKITVKNAKIVLPSGRRYSFLVAPHNGAMLPEVLTKLKTLVGQGAVIVLKRPDRSPSLKQYPKCDEQVKKIASELWANKEVYRKGKVFETLNKAIEFTGLTPDYLLTPALDSRTIGVVHRTSPDAEIYYITNLTPTPQQFSASLRIDGKKPEIWDADKGTIETAKDWHFENTRTVVDFSLRPFESKFVVLRTNATAQDIAEGARPKAIEQVDSTYTVSGAWKVSFAPKIDKPFERVFYQLSDFSMHTDREIMYFAGTATYKKTVKVNHEAIATGKRVVINIGEMNDIAMLKVNGKNLDVLWYPPYDVDITSALKAGDNTIEIAVTNNWANRLIGDEQEPADFEWGTDRGQSMGRAMKAYPDWFIKNQPRPSSGRKAFVTWYYHRPNSTLEKAGLVGPVQFIFSSIKN